MLDLIILILLIVVIVIVILHFWPQISAKLAAIRGGKDALWIDPFYNAQERKVIKGVCKKNPQILKMSNLFVNLKEKPPLKFRGTGFDLFRTSVHDGQRKLLLNEIYFLTHYGHLSNTVVYAGSAPGHHIKVLLELFPKHKFILWDPRRFDEDFYNLPERIETHNEYFTVDAAKKYTDEKVLFISDIRVSPEEEQVFTDMKMQQEWVQAMKPIAFMLKFRPPWDNKPINYLDGQIMIQPYPPRSSSETRLIAANPKGEYKMKKYNILNYDGLLFTHNAIMRQWAFYNNPVFQELSAENRRGRNRNWDSTAELLILVDYVEKNKSQTLNDVLKLINSTLMGSNIYKLDPMNLGTDDPCIKRKQLYIQHGQSSPSESSNK